MNDTIHQPIRVAIVDDHAGVRAGIRILCETAKDIVIVGEGETGVDALNLVKTQKPDILLLDIEIPMIKGNEVAKRLRDQKAEVQVLAVSSYSELYHVQGMLNSGAAGYLVKDEVPQWLLVAIRALASRRKKPWLSPKVKNRLANLPNRFQSRIYDATPQNKQTNFSTR